MDAITGSRLHRLKKICANHKIDDEVTLASNLMNHVLVVMNVKESPKRGVPTNHERLRSAILSTIFKFASKPLFEGRYDCGGCIMESKMILALLFNFQIVLLNQLMETVIFRVVEEEQGGEASLAKREVAFFSYMSLKDRLETAASWWGRHYKVADHGCRQSNNTERRIGEDEGEGPFCILNTKTRKFLWCETKKTCLEGGG